MPRSAIHRPKPPKNFDENPEWKAADFQRAQSMADIMPGVVDALKRGPGRPKSDTPKEVVSIRLDAAALKAFRKTGAGWQGRVNAVLVKAAKQLDTKKAAPAKRAHAQA